MTQPPPLSDHLKEAFNALLTSAAISKASIERDGHPTVALLSGALADSTPVGIISLVHPQPDSSILLYPIAIIPSDLSFFDTVTGPDGADPFIHMPAPVESPEDVARRAGLIVPPSPPPPPSS